MENTNQEQTPSINIVRRHLLKTTAVAAPLVLTLGARNASAQWGKFNESGAAPYSAVAKGSVDLNGNANSGDGLYLRIQGGAEEREYAYYGKVGSGSVSVANNNGAVNVSATCTFKWTYGSVGTLSAIRDYERDKVETWVSTTKGRAFDTSYIYTNFTVLYTRDDSGFHATFTATKNAETNVTGNYYYFYSLSNNPTTLPSDLRMYDGTTSPFLAAIDSLETLGASSGGYPLS
ncbi:MAG: hypothetical protein Q4D98_05940 [Planctomycetia bacterium]|nr:hypothetical protein [Planctomycetia bacterium]